MAKNVVLKVVLLVVLVVIIAAAVFARPAEAAGNLIQLQARTLLLNGDIGHDLGSLNLITLGGKTGSLFLKESLYKLNLLPSTDELKIAIRSLSLTDLSGARAIDLLTLC